MSEDITGHLRVWKDGTRVDVISHYTNFGKRRGGGQRGKVDPGFSPQSRKRLFDLLNTLNEHAMRKALFVTLTYKRDYVKPKEVKSNLKSFIQSIRRNYPLHSGIWKLEFQRRGSPHFHIIVFGRYIPHDWVAVQWNRIAENGDRDHLRAGTEVRAVKDRRSACAYVGKYMGKLAKEEAKEHVGRLWGVFNRKALPVSRVEIIALNGSKARDIISEWGPGIVGHGGENLSALSLYAKSSSELAKEVERVTKGGS